MNPALMEWEQDPGGALSEVLIGQPVVAAILERVPSVDLQGWYLGAGCVAQTVWNAFHEFDLTFGIKDYDLVYFDHDDLSEQGELDTEQRVAELVSDLGVIVDVTNEARVHVWYEDRFGRPIEPYVSSDAAIATWPTTATSVGVRRSDDALEVCAPFGLDDLFRMIVRPNKRLVTRDVYEAKATRWQASWPLLTVLGW